MDIRPARPEDPAAALLYESAKPYYDAYAGGGERARALLEAIYPRPGHAASYELCHVAIASDGRLVGVVAGFPVLEGDRLARHFVRLSVPRLHKLGVHQCGTLDRSRGAVIAGAQ